MEELHDPVSKRVGRVLRKIREEQGLTRAQLSEKSTVSERQISAIELGEKGPSLNSLELLLRSLGASADQLFYPELSENDPTLAQIVHLAGVCNVLSSKIKNIYMKPANGRQYFILRTRAASNRGRAVRCLPRSSLAGRWEDQSERPFSSHTAHNAHRYYSAAPLRVFVAAILQTSAS